MVRSTGFAIGIALSALGCSFNEAPAGGTCIQGQELRCLCDDGSYGVYTCQSDGTFSACMCTLESPGAAGSGPAGQAGARASSAGSSATAGSSAMGSAGGAGAGAGAGHGGAGAPAAGAGGAAGSPGTAGSPPAGGAGAGAGAGGSAGAGFGGDGGRAGAPPEPGGAYTECTSDENCDTGLFCTASNSGGAMTTGYCTMLCNSNGGGSCPKPPSGTVGATCVQFAGICALGSCQQAECPSGMECTQVPLPFGGEMLWNCSYR